MSSNPALETALHQLKLPTFSRNYRRLAGEAAATNAGYDRYLQALAEQELAQRDLTRQRRCLQQARYVSTCYGHALTEMCDITPRPPTPSAVVSVTDRHAGVKGPRRG